MSLHVQLSPEALENLRRQQRNSTISSIVVSILVVALIFLILGVCFLHTIIKESPTIVTYESSTTQEEEITQKKVNTQMQKKPSAPSSSMTKVIASNSAASPVSIPVPEVDVSTPSMDFGDGQDFGGGWGDSGDFGTGGGFGKIPTDMRKRCSPSDRLARLKESGGSPKCEEAVEKALEYFQKTQKPDGSWDNAHPVAMTGLALLAYLGRCETPQSKKYGDTVLKAITYLVDVGLKANDGRLTNKPPESIQWVYDHAIASYALAESYTFCSKLNINVPDLDKVAKKSIEMIMEGQAESGSWLYKYSPTKTDGDNSVGYWQIQAMKAGKHTGLWKDAEFKKHSRLALKWLEKVQGSDGSIGYRNNSAVSPGLTGGGVLAFQMWGEGNFKAAKNGIKWISQNAKFNWGSAESNLYYHYYHVQAMMNHGGKEWDEYNEMFRDVLLENQKPDGSWQQPSFGGHGPINDHMTTCLATLMLEVYYRFLPGTGSK